MNTEGEWAQLYTRRGAPMSGRYRWRTFPEKRQETYAAIVIAVVMLTVVLLPTIIWELSA